MLAAEIVARSHADNVDLIVAGVADEEYASLGTEALVAGLLADAAVVTEPTGLRLCTAHKGFAWITIETTGRAAHGSKPDLGIDAIAHMGRVLVGLEELSARLARRPPHPLVGTASMHASLIEGGQELSSYPERCRLQIERRTIPGETRQSVSDEIEQMLDELRGDSAGFSATSEAFFWREPFEIPRDEEIVRAVAAGASQVMGRMPEVYGDTPWMDAAILSAAGIPTVVYGPGGAGAHATSEYVLIDEVAACADALARTVIDFCSEPSPRTRG